MPSYDSDTNDSGTEGVLSTVLGYVSRELQDFLVTAVTGSSKSISEVSSHAQPTSSRKNKRSGRTNDSQSILKNKKRNRPSSPHPNRDDYGEHEEEDDYDDRRTRRKDRSGAGGSYDRRPVSPPRTERSNSPSLSPPITFKAPLPVRRNGWDPSATNSPQPHPTMPGSLFERSPTPAEYRTETGGKSKVSRSSVSGASSTRGRSASRSQPSGSSRSQSRRRSTSRVRFAPHAVRHPARELDSLSDSDDAKQNDDNSAREGDTPPSSSTTRPTRANTPPLAEPAIPVEVALEPVRQVIKIEDDDEIVILDRMPTPPLNQGIRLRKSPSSATSTREPTTTQGRSAAPSLFAGDRTMSPSELMPASASARQNDGAVAHDPKGKGKERETSRDRDQSQERSEETDREEQQRIRQLEEEVQRLKAQLEARSSTDQAPPPPPTPPPPPPPGYIAIPATVWANGPRHPSARGDVHQPPSKNSSFASSLKPSVPTESMEDFLKELKTAKLKRIAAADGPAISPMTARRNATTNTSSMSNSSICSGLRTLKAGLKRKAGAVEVGDEHPLPTATRRRVDMIDDSTDSVGSTAQEESNLHASTSTANTSNSSSNNWAEGSASGRLSQRGPSRPSKAYLERLAASVGANSLNSSGVPRVYFGGLAPPPVANHDRVLGLPSSDVTTPSLCSDTEDNDRDRDHIRDVSEQQFNAPTPPRAEDEEETVEIVEETFEESSSYHRQEGRGDQVDRRRGGSDLRLTDLFLVSADKKGKSKARDVTPNNAVHDTPAPSAPDPVRRRPSLHHPMPVPGTPSVFSARPPKSPFVGVDISSSRPRPPARSSRSVSVGSQPSLQRKKSLELHTSAILRDVHEFDDEDEDVDEETSRLQLVPLPRERVRERLHPSSAPADEDEEYEEDEEEDESMITSQSSVNRTLHSTMQQSFKTSKPPSTRPTQSRAANSASSVSLDEELRRVAVNERIADLELGYHAAEGDDDDDDSGVYIGIGLRDSKHGRFTSGGGGGGIPVTAAAYDEDSPEPQRKGALYPPLPSLRKKSSTGSMKSRIPLPRGMNRG
ncbi:hypothetical protein FRB95_003827 [Tulasnella sp. JGI-2019a]|nr:hypothetical protein FRB95_003827 [Tulasnella sp. JGI-2019a]